MTETCNGTSLIFALHEIYHNHAREYETSENVDPNTGEFVVTAKTIKLAPGRIHEVPAALADELFALAANQATLNIPPVVREPEEREVLSFRHSKGDFITKA